MQVNANVSEADIGLIAEGMRATFTVDAYPTRTFEGTISQIRYNATILDSVVTYVTLLQVDNDDLSLRPGMTANVTFEVAKAEDVIRIPNSALRFDPNPPEPGAPPPRRPRSSTPTVYQLVKGRPRAVSVRIGLSDGSFSQLVEGELKEGEVIITDRNWSAAGTAPRTDMTQTLRPGGGGGGMRRM
jgi:HlyD family secretion protein